jgi:adhesin HecA-like repeat protein
MVAHMAHAVGDQGRMRRLHHRAAVLVLDEPAAGQAALLVGRVVGAGEDGDHARRALRLRRVDLLDVRAGMGRAQDIGVGLTRPVNVVGVGAAAGEEAEIFLALDRRSDELRHDYLPIAFAPAETAFTMLW